MAGISTVESKQTAFARLFKAPRHLGEHEMVAADRGVAFVRDRTQAVFADRHIPRRRQSLGLLPD